MHAEDPKRIDRLDFSQEARLLRLAGLGSADTVSFVSELHAFIEDFVHDSYPELETAEGFDGLLRAFSRARGVRGRDALRTIELLIREHELLATLKRGAGVLDSEEALAARHNFLRFCALAGIESRALENLAGPLRGWDDRRAPAAEGGERERIQSEILDGQAGNGELLERSAEWARDKQHLAELEGEALRLRVERTRETERGESGKARVVDLDRELDDNARQRAALAERLVTYRDLDLYVQNVNRFSLYTRTRMDYERSVLRLTAEQEEAAHAARPGRDLLIRGGAGTGKTIVLLHAFGEAVRNRKGELALDARGPFLFLTYTRTLVKYDRYVAEILKEPDSGALILTADSFFQDRIRLRGQQQKIDFGVVQRLAEKLNTTGFFSAQELAVEVEDFIFGSMVTRREYVEERIPRRGMRQPLSAGQREAVWNVRDRMVEAMEHDGVLSRNYSRCVLIAHLEAHPQDGSLRDLDAAFVDESQDLTAADLRALKLMSRRGLVMAGDTGQSIYGVGSPYRRAGVDIAGRTRVLHTSFRNTVPIQAVADAYRALSGLEGDEGSGAVAFRDGPAPELYTAATRPALVNLLLRKTSLFIEALGYDPENVAILAPTRTDLATIGDSLGHAGYRWANVHDEEFTFKETGTIRLSTLHSSKGLDFAVVLLYLPALPPRGVLDDRAGQGIVRNLLYVAMTRAIDNVNVFTLEGAHEGQEEEPLQDLVRVFRQYQRNALLPPGDAPSAAR
jgi:hypothetical protein